MSNLGSGVQVNTGKLTTGQELADLQNGAIDLSLIANTNFDLDGTTMLFYAPFDLQPTAKEKAEITGCSRNIQCTDQADFTVPLNKWQNDIFAFATCPTNMLTPQRLGNALASYVKGWRKNEVDEVFEVAETDYPAYAGDVTGLNKFEVIEDMIVVLEERGYDRSNITVSLNTQTASDYRKIYQGCCELGGAVVTAEVNSFGVRNVVNAKNYQTADVLVYVHDYLLFGNYCRSLPELWDGTDTYKGRSLIGGEEGFGVGIYNPSVTGLQYTAL